MSCSATAAQRIYEIFDTPPAITGPPVHAARPAARVPGTSSECEPLRDWLRTAQHNRRRLLELLDAIHNHPLPEPSGDHDSLVEYDRRRDLKEQLIYATIATCLDTSLAVGLLRGACGELSGCGRNAVKRALTVGIEIFDENTRRLPVGADGKCHAADREGALADGLVGEDIAVIVAQRERHRPVDDRLTVDARDPFQQPHSAPQPHHVRFHDDDVARVHGTPKPHALDAFRPRAGRRSAAQLCRAHGKLDHHLAVAGGVVVDEDTLAVLPDLEPEADEIALGAVDPAALQFGLVQDVAGVEIA